MFDDVFARNGSGRAEKLTSVSPWSAATPAEEWRLLAASAEVRRCRLKPVEPRLESAWFERLKLNCDGLV
jgi:hypothetical protein